MSVSKQIVEKWHEALNQGNVEEMAALVHPDVEIVGPRGSTQGVQMMREWFVRANVRLVPVAYFANGQTSHGHTLVVQENGEWIDPATGDMQSSLPVVTIFCITDQRITRIVRCDPV